MKKTLIVILAAMMAIPAFADKKPSKKGEVKEVTFVVAIDCENCVRKVEENIAFERGVKDLKVSLEGQTVYIKYDAAKTNEEVLKAAIEKFYPVSGTVEKECESGCCDNHDNHDGHDHSHHGHSHHGHAHHE